MTVNQMGIKLHTNFVMDGIIRPNEIRFRLRLSDDEGPGIPIFEYAGSKVPLVASEDIKYTGKSGKITDILTNIMNNNYFNVTDKVTGKVEELIQNLIQKNLHEIFSKKVTDSFPQGITDKKWGIGISVKTLGGYAKTRKNGIVIP